MGLRIMDMRNAHRTIFVFGQFEQITGERSAHAEERAHCLHLRIERPVGSHPATPERNVTALHTYGVAQVPQNPSGVNDTADQPVDVGLDPRMKHKFLGKPKFCVGAPFTK